MDNWKEKFYKSYISSHLSFAREEASSENIKKQFVFWDSYFGKFLPSDKKAMILDAGCGEGGLILWMRSLGYENVFGVENSEEQIEAAKRLGILGIEKARMKEFLKNKKEIYDTIFLKDVIEHFDKEEALAILEMAFTSLKKGGKLIIQTPNAESPFGARYRYYDFTHETAFTPTSLNQIFKVVGFKKVNFYPEGPVAHGIKSFIRAVLWQLIVLGIKFYLIVETGTGKGIFTRNIIVVAVK